MGALPFALIDDGVRTDCASLLAALERPGVAVGARVIRVRDARVMARRKPEGWVVEP